MPKLIAQNEIRLEWSDLGKRVPKRKPRSADVRSTGWHLAAIVKHALQSQGLMKQYEQSDDMPLSVIMGMFWEEGIVSLYPDMVWQPGEIHKDEIYGSPDGISTSDELGCDVLEEFKLTYKSYRTHGDIPNEHLWMWQVGGYLKILGLQYVRMHVCWACGDYNRPIQPKYMTYLVKWEQEELDRLWTNVILRYRDGAPKEEH